MLTKYREQLKALDYPNGDHLELSVEYVWSRDEWKAHLTGIQRRGFCTYVSVMGRDYYASTPEDAAALAVNNAPREWACEPGKLAARRTEGGVYLMPIPISRPAST